MAIYQDIQITVNQGLAQPDKSLYIFRGDSNIILNFKLVTPEYKLTKDNKDNLVTKFAVDNFELRLQLEKDYNRIIKGEMVENGMCSVLLTQNIIQQLRVGSYTYQITLIDANDNAIMTFPACNSKLNILDRISINAEEFVNATEAYASFCNADTAILAIADEEPEDILDANGDYNKKVWVNGDLIMASDLNRLEWISYLNRQLLNEHTNALSTQATHITNNTSRLNELHQEIVDARQSGSTSYSKLGDRLDAVDSQLAHIESQVESVINMEQFPRLDGETTDTNRIKRAINYSIEILKTNGIGSFKIIEFNSGKYIIDEGIQIPTFIKFKSIGNVIFISKVDGVMFKMYTPTNLNIGQSIDIPSARWSLYNGMWLNGIDGGITIIRDASITKESSIALEIGNSVDTSGAEYMTGWWNISNVSIVGFNIGIKFNSYDMFLGKFDKIIISGCNKAITFEAQTVNHISNSGESIAFNNSIFGDNEIGIYIKNWPDLELVFNGCSFDFVGKGLETNKEGFYRFTNCHFEGIGFTNTMTEIGGDDACLIHSTGTYWNAPNVFIMGCDFMSIRGELFKASVQNGMNVFINSLISKGSNGFERLYAVCDDNVSVQVNNFVSSKNLNMITQRKLNRKINPNFDNIELDLAITDNMEIDGYKFTTGFSNRTTITNEKSYISGNKSLKINIPSGGLYLTMMGEEMNCKPGDKILSNFFWYTETTSNRQLGRMIIKTNFYDKNGALIPYPSTVLDAGSMALKSTNNEWNRLFQMEQVIAPFGAVKCRSTYVMNPVEECTLYLSEFYSLIY